MNSIKNLNIFVLKGDFDLTECKDVSPEEFEKICGSKLFPFVHAWDNSLGIDGGRRVELRYEGCYSGPHMYYFDSSSEARLAAKKLAEMLNTAAHGDL